MSHNDGMPQRPSMNKIIQKTARLLPHMDGSFMILNTDEIALALEEAGYTLFAKTEDA